MVKRKVKKGKGVGDAWMGQEGTQSSGIKPSRLLPTSRGFAFSPIEKILASRTVKFSLDSNGFYLDCRKLIGHFLLSICDWDHGLCRRSTGPPAEQKMNRNRELFLLLKGSLKRKEINFVSTPSFFWSWNIIIISSIVHLPCKILCKDETKFGWKNQKLKGIGGGEGVWSARKMRSKLPL